MDWIERTARAKRESKYIEFKGEFDLGSTGDWCEVIKDIVSISNSGEGTIAFGLDSHGDPTDFDVSGLLSMDPSVMADKIYQYTGIHFSGFDFSDFKKQGRTIAILQINESPVPMVFTKPGTYPIENGGRQRTAFSQGTVYFRHGAKSEPGNSEDLRRVIDRNVERMRRSWMDGVRKVVNAPQGSELTILPRDVWETTSPGAVGIRVVDDPAAPAFRRLDPNQTHPYRQKELREKINGRLPKGTTINSYDVLIARELHKLGSISEYVYLPKYAAPQYSDACADWFLDRYSEDPQFFIKARETYAAHR